MKNQRKRWNCKIVSLWLDPMVEKSMKKKKEKKCKFGACQTKRRWIIKADHEIFIGYCNLIYDPQSILLTVLKFEFWLKYWQIVNVPATIIISNNNNELWQNIFAQQCIAIYFSKWYACWNGTDRMMKMLVYWHICSCFFFFFLRLTAFSLLILPLLIYLLIYAEPWIQHYCSGYFVVYYYLY